TRPILVNSRSNLLNQSSKVIYTINNFLKILYSTSMERTFNNKQIPVKMTSSCK
ncbi:unnamed protein product, partial [Arabidopsis halleri]